MRIDQLPSWQVNQVALEANRLVAEAGVRKQRFAVLTALAQRGPASQAELGRMVWMDRSDMHAILRELEDEGLVARAQDERDRRRNVVSLTPAGERALADLRQRVAAAQDALLEPLSAAERRDLRQLLSRILEHHR
jgi:MarR family transcriptional regulator, lower aerobic nicotinate degradation pathway regulator